MSLSTFSLNIDFDLPGVVMIWVMSSAKIVSGQHVPGNGKSLVLLRNTLLHTLSLPLTAHLRPQGTLRPHRCTGRARQGTGGCVTSTQFGWASVAKCTYSSSKWKDKADTEFTLASLLSKQYIYI